MINKIFLKEINYDNCTIILEDYEVDFLYDLISKENYLTEKSLSNSLYEFCKLSDKRYFRPNQVKEISKIIFEEIGRSYDSDTITGNLSKQRFLADDGIFYDEGIYLDDNIINFNIDGKKSMRKISNEDEGNVIAHNLVRVSINRKN